MEIFFRSFFLLSPPHWLTFQRTNMHKWHLNFSAEPHSESWKMCNIHLRNAKKKREEDEIKLCISHYNIDSRLEHYINFNWHFYLFNFPVEAFETYTLFTARTLTQHQLGKCNLIAWINKCSHAERHMNNECGAESNKKWNVFNKLTRTNIFIHDEPAVAIKNEYSFHPRMWER